MRKMWRWLLNLTVVVLISLANLKAKAQTQPVGIRKAIEMALANNNTLKADSMKILAAGYETEVLKSSFRPQVSYNSKMEFNPAVPSQMLPGTIVGQPSKEMVPVQFGTRYGMGSSVEVTQAIIRNDIRSQMDAAALNKSMAKTKYQLTREELVYQVATSFYSLQANAEMIRTTTRDYLNIKEILAIAKAQFENGVIKRIDYESLQINAANKESYLNQLQTQYNDQLAYFNYLLGIPADTQTNIDDHLPALGSMVQQGSTVLQREDIRLSKQLIESKEIELKTIRAEALPTVSSYFRFNYQSQFNNAGDAINNDYWFKSSTVGITASFSIFDGHRRKHRANIVKTQIEQLKFESDQRQDLAKTEQTTAWTTYNNEKKQFSITEQNLVLAEKVFVSRKALYTEGVTTLIELLDAERELSNSRNLHIQSMINVQTSMVNVHKSNGTLLTDFLKSL